MHWKVLDHIPYSLGVSLCHFNVFGPLKIAQKSCRFRSDKDVKTTVVQWFQQQPKELFVEVIHRLVCEWDACFSAHGDIF
jgi:hypothetical protein